MSEFITGSELYHYGVLGMKWGHHKTKNVDKKKKSIFNKKNIAIGAMATAGILASLGCMYLIKKNKIDPHGRQTLSFGKIIDLKSLSNDDTVLKAGTKFHRISSKPIEEYTKKGKELYVSYMHKDNRFYKEIMPKNLNDWIGRHMIEGKQNVSYEHVITCNKAIKVPSKRKIAQAYMKANNVNIIDDGRYKQFMEQLADRGDVKVSKFFDIIRNNGYNAIVDENDAGVISKKPLILLNPSDDIKDSKSHKIRALEKILNVILM